jgi:hypothetical protein
MAIKTFTTGEVLTAADTNTYLANSGLVYISSTTIGSGVSSVTVTNAFSSTYSSYKIIVNSTASTAASIYCQLGNGGTFSTASYNNALVYIVGGTLSAASNIGTTSFTWMGGSNGANTCRGQWDLMGPFEAKFTRMANGIYQDGNNYGTCQGEHQVATSYADLKVFQGTGTLTGGTITIYGYRTV